jgi:hypothetical protein
VASPSAKEDFYSIDEIDGLQWPTIFDELEKTRESALACLRQHGLPDEQEPYLVGPGARWRRIEKADLAELADRKEPYTVHFGYWNGDAEVDTPAWLAVELLTKIQQLETAFATMDCMLAVAYARTIGRLEERLFWKQKHEAAAYNGYRHQRYLADAGKASAKGRTGHKSSDIEDLANLLKSTPGLDASDRSLALLIMKMDNRFSRLGLSTLRNYLSLARKRKLLRDVSLKNSNRAAERQ